MPSLSKPHPSTDQSFIRYWRRDCNVLSSGLSLCSALPSPKDEVRKAVDMEQGMDRRIKPGPSFASVSWLHSSSQLSALRKLTRLLQLQGQSEQVYPWSSARVGSHRTDSSSSKASR